jgi:hypothetical protein
MCEQVAVEWWHGRVDFLHAQHRMLIQADGSCHDTGAYHNSAEQLVKRDAAFCAAAYARYLPSGGSVLRTCESNLLESLPTGVKLAKAGRVICHQGTLLVMILMNVQYCSSDASVTPARYLINQDKAYCVALKQVVDLLVYRRLTHCEIV